MYKYSYHIKRCTVYRQRVQYRFSAHMLRHLHAAADDVKKSVKEEVHAFFEKNWKAFGDALIEHALFDAFWVLLLKDSDGLAGVATLHKKVLNGATFYNFKTSAVHPKYHSLGVLERMNKLLFQKAYTDNVIHNRSLWMRMIFTTPNMRIVGFFAKHTRHIYPNPFLFDTKTHKLPLPDEQTWEIVQAYNRVDFPADLPLSKEGCVVDDPDSEWPYYCYEKNGIPRYENSVVNAFGKHYLRLEEGKKRMVVVTALITPVDVVRYFVGYVLKLLKKALQRAFS